MKKIDRNKVRKLNADEAEKEELMVMASKTPEERLLNAQKLHNMAITWFGERIGYFYEIKRRMEKDTGFHLD